MVSNNQLEQDNIKVKNKSRRYIFSGIAENYIIKLHVVLEQNSE